MNNQKCKIRSDVVNVNTNEPVFYSYSIIIDYINTINNTIIESLMNNTLALFLFILIGI